MDWSNLGKNRSKFGSYLDRKGIAQEELAKKSSVSNSTISRLCQPYDFQPNMKTWAKIKKALQSFGQNVDYDDFWSM